MNKTKQVLPAPHGWRKKRRRKARRPSRIERMLRRIQPARRFPGPDDLAGTMPVSAVLVIDASWSMDLDDWKPSRLAGAKKAAHAYCERVSRECPDARIGIVAFGCHAQVFSALIEVAKIDRLDRAIDAISYLGGTNIRSGLVSALQLARSSRSSCQVVLLSDGENTNRSPLGVAESLKKIATIECIGIGGSPTEVDENELKAIASMRPDGSKRYRWIGDPEELAHEFERLAGRIMRP